MSKSNSGSSRPSSGKGSASFGRGVTPARLSQPSGTTVGGVTKVNHGNGTFSMQRTPKSK